MAKPVTGTPMGPDTKPFQLPGQQGTAGNRGVGVSSRGGLGVEKPPVAKGNPSYYVSKNGKIPAEATRVGRMARGASQLSRAIPPLAVLGESANLATNTYRPFLDDVNTQKNVELSTLSGGDPTSSEAQQGMADLFWRGGISGGPGHNAPSNVNMTASHNPGMLSALPPQGGLIPDPEVVEQLSGMKGGQPASSSPGATIGDFEDTLMAKAAGYNPDNTVDFGKPAMVPYGPRRIDRNGKILLTNLGPEALAGEFNMDTLEPHRQGTFSQIAMSGGGGGLPSPIDIDANGRVIPITGPDMTRRSLAERYGDVTGGGIPDTMEGFMVANFMQNQLRMDDSRRVGDNKEIYKADLGALPQFMEQERKQREFLANMEMLPYEIDASKAQAEASRGQAMRDKAAAENMPSKEESRTIEFEKRAAQDASDAASAYFKDNNITNPTPGEVRAVKDFFYLSTMEAFEQNRKGKKARLTERQPATETSWLGLVGENKPAIPMGIAYE